MTVLAAVLAATAVYLFFLFRSYRHRFYLVTARDQHYRIPTCTLEDFDARFRPGPFGPTPDAEIVFIGGAEKVRAGVTDREAWILGVLARDAHLLFEFGTATGKTAYLLARNAPADACVITLTLPPEGRTLYQHAKGDRESARRVALEESSFNSFYYTGTPAESKVTQLYGDSKTLDIAAWRGRCDLVFVDGAHAYSYVINDSRLALQLVAPGGVILWHDYKRRRGPTRDVMRALEELAREVPLVRLAGTHLVGYRARV